MHNGGRVNDCSRLLTLVVNEGRFYTSEASSILAMTHTALTPSDWREDSLYVDGEAV